MEWRAFVQCATAAYRKNSFAFGFIPLTTVWRAFCVWWELTKVIVTAWMLSVHSTKADKNQLDDNCTQMENQKQNKKNCCVLLHVYEKSSGIQSLFSISKSLYNFFFLSRSFYRRDECHSIHIIIFCANAKP